MSQLLPLSEAQIHHNRSKAGLLIEQTLNNSSMNSLSHILMVVLPFKHLNKFRSRRINLQINLVTSAIIGVGDVRIAIISRSGVGSGGVIVITLERMSPASHRTRETRAVNSLRNAISSFMIVLVRVGMVTHENEQREKKKWIICNASVDLLICLIVK